MFRTRILVLALVAFVPACARRTAPSPAVVVEPERDGPDEIPPPREVKPRPAASADTGRQLFAKLKCSTCHTGTATAKGPVLENLYGTKAPLEGGGTADADEAYLVESIRKPRAKVVEGWTPIMPAYDETQASAEEVNALVAYIKSLKPGDLRAIEERFPAPNGAPIERPELAPPPRQK